MRAVLVVVLCLWSSVSVAQTPDFKSGNFFLPGCKSFLADLGVTSTVAREEGECLGIVITLLRFGEELTTQRRNCAPANITNGEAIRVVVVFLEARPQRLHENFIDLSAEALAMAWPCKK
jgi:Rap1a immunity proteins